jgi:hypothetical protein
MSGSKSPIYGLTDSLSTFEISPIASSTAEIKTEVAYSPSIIEIKDLRIEFAYDFDRSLFDLTNVFISFAASSLSLIS